MNVSDGGDSPGYLNIDLGGDVNIDLDDVGDGLGDLIMDGTSKFRILSLPHSVID